MGLENQYVEILEKVKKLDGKVRLNYHHVYDGRRGAYAKITINGKDYIGTSECSIQDKFNKRIGRSIALGRAWRNYQDGLHKSYDDSFVEFVDAVSKVPIVKKNTLADTFTMGCDSFDEEFYYAHCDVQEYVEKYVNKMIEKFGKTAGAKDLIKNWAETIFGEEIVRIQNGD